MVGRDGSSDAGPAEVVDDLYGAPPADFTARRDRLVHQAKEGGDRELARALQGLRRPTAAAWAVNLLTREEAELLAQVIEIGEALRQAQARLEGDALRELSRQRRDLVTAVVARAGALVAQHGGSLSAAGEQQVAATLNAALADPAAADAVTSGRLVKPMASTGLGEVALTDHVATLEGRPEGGSGRSRPGQDEVTARAARRRRAQLQAARDRVAAARASVDEAEAEHDAARGRHEAARAQALHLEARIDELRRRVADLEAEAETLDGRLAGIEQEARAAEGVAEAARAELEASQEELRALESP